MHQGRVKWKNLDVLHHSSGVGSGFVSLWGSGGGSNRVS